MTDKKNENLFCTNNPRIISPDNNCNTAEFTFDENDNIAFGKYPQENIHLLESFSSISTEIKREFKNKKITNYSIIEYCDLSQNFRKSGILTRESFMKLEGLIGREIHHEVILGNSPKHAILNLSHNKYLAEFIGILISKGRIDKSSLYINISGICKNILFLDYLYKLFYKIFSLDKERILPQYSSNSLSAIRINSVVIVYALERLGIISQNSNFLIPPWIFNQNDYMISCLKGMFEIGGTIVVNSRSAIELRFVRPKEYIVKYFGKLCSLFNIETSRIYTHRREGTIGSKKYFTVKYYINIGKKSTVKKFLNLIPTLKWELSRNRIQSKLKERNLTLNEVLEFRYNYDRRDKILRQYPFEYNLNNLHNISNLNLKQKLLNLFNIIENGCFDHNIFKSGNPRCSLFRIKGSQENKLFNHYLSPFEEDLTINNIVIDNSFVGQKLTMLVNQAEQFYLHQPNAFSLKHNITHFFLQNYVSNNEENNFIINYILAIELLLWTEINTNTFGFNYVTGHADFLLYYNNTFYLCDYKPEEISFLPTIPQVSMYGILFDKFINLKNINIKCITFNKNDSWEYNPSILFTHIPVILKNLQNQGIPIDPIWEKCYSNDYKTFFISIL